MPNGFVQNPSLLVLLQISNKNIKTGSAARGSAVDGFDRSAN
jgi:hypothetical protein